MDHPDFAPTGRATTAKLLGMFLLIVGVKFWILQLSSAPLPIYDQWEAEGMRILQPWLHGNLHAAALFEPWVQHRILWTRLMVLGLFRLNGQWDTQVQAIVAACMHAGTALLLGAILTRRLPRAYEDAVLLCLLLLFSLPFGLENTLSGGFQSQYYLLLFFTVVTVWGLGSHRPGSAGWWTGAAGAVGAWFTVATGALPAFAVAAWMAVRLVRREGSARGNGLTLGVALALGAGGLGLSFFGVDTRSELRPDSAVELFARFFGLLGWPLPTPWAAPLAWTPFAWLVWRTLRGRRPTNPLERFLIPLGFFALLNTAAIAYARNHYATLQVSRYMDLLSFGALVNFMCLLLFLRESGGEGRPARARLPVGLLMAAWVAAAGYGAIQLTSRAVANTLPFVRTCSRHEVENMVALLAGSDPRRFDARHLAITLCDNPRVAGEILQDPLILQILPAAVRAPVVLEAETTTAGVRRVKPAADNDIQSGWALEPAPGQRGPVHFRSRTLRGGGLPYLSFPDVSDLGSDAFMALVDDRTGTATWLAPGTVRDGRQSILVRVPDGPFHVEAVVAAGAGRTLQFGYPRAVGWLSAWVDPVLGGAEGLLAAGCVCWLGAVFWRRLGLDALDFALRPGDFRVPAWSRHPLPVLPHPQPASDA